MPPFDLFAARPQRELRAQRRVPMPIGGPDIYKVHLQRGVNYLQLNDSFYGPFDWRVMEGTFDLFYQYRGGPGLPKNAFMRFGCWELVRDQSPSGGGGGISREPVRLRGPSAAPDRNHRDAQPRHEREQHRERAQPGPHRCAARRHEPRKRRCRPLPQRRLRASRPSRARPRVRATRQQHRETPQNLEDDWTRAHREQVTRRVSYLIVMPPSIFLRYSSSFGSL